ncbi:hypothetical protein C1Y41_04085 [Pantoea sp. ICBG 1758]|uniref:M91 family zinc metallopeptidase n=1 Tax=Pantoea sp. ICBG 1758 TaxID=2071682 RepID=UPI000CE44352|nr:M91 family zinc metallopeptidase [Pantoea sp. ICBG 1758]PPC63830.1 hypothetical protein C1Y41_04085 [Pantoea sp. ICBG 1758]
MPISIATDCSRISIEANRQEDVNEIDTLITRIRNTTAGKSLLKTIESESRNGRSIHIMENSWMPSQTVPVLTESQAASRDLYPRVLHQESMDTARTLAVKKGMFKAEGTAAYMHFNLREGNIVDSRGETTYAPYRQSMNEKVANLAHELIHAMRILKGTYTNDESDKGYEDEEMRAIGSGKYADEAISENKIRQPLALYTRDSGPFTENTFGLNGSNARPGVSFKSDRYGSWD